MNNSRGYSVFELMVVVGLIATLLSVSGSQLQNLNNNSVNGAAQLAAFIKTVRARSLATTSAYRIQPTSNTTVNVTYGADCEVGTAHTPSELELELPAGAILADDTWALCYTARGIADANAVVEIFDLDNQYKQIEIYLGGAVRTYLSHGVS